jgi:hypothetical protein
MEQGDISKVYTSKNIQAMRSAGFLPLTYRLRTELGVEAWHWNPVGRFSDSKNQHGYWISESTPQEHITISNGYDLPRRGNTGDQANNKGYSRLCDGDFSSFWKSNPYLDQYFTHEDNRLHPQWVAIDFKKRVPVDAMELSWGTPYAIRYHIQYWEGTDPNDPSELPEHSGWRDFPKGVITSGRGGRQRIKLANTPQKTRWVRLWLTEHPKMMAPTGGDVRDVLGFALCEVGVGTLDGWGAFHDQVRHGKPPHVQQTRFYTSSTDPWHRARDRDHNVEQPGFDTIAKSGLTNQLPVLWPVGILYETPENAVAQIRWLKARHFPLNYIEMGEEPDGQYILPEDYGALYVQWAEAIHAVDPSLKLGGPGFQTVLPGWQAWPDSQGNTAWMSRFLAYLKRRGHLTDFAFFSFEWYPFDRVATSATARQLLVAPDLMRSTFATLRQEGVPTDIPWVISEYGYSSFAGQAEVDLPGALLNADIVGTFLTLGGGAAYLYGYEPNTLLSEVESQGSWGNLMLFLADNNRRIRCPLPTYYGATLLNYYWVDSRSERGNGLHEIYATISPTKQITAYAIRRPDKKWALLLLNKDPKNPYIVRLSLAHKQKGEMWQYGPQQFAWHAQKDKGFPCRNLPPVHKSIQGNTLRLPPYSLTVFQTDTLLSPVPRIVP